MNSYVARQPILDCDMKVFGYELLFRSGDAVKSYMAEDADKASLNTVMAGFYSIGLENITGRKPAFINFTESVLASDVATLFPKELLVVELTSKIRLTDYILAACAALVEKGYSIAIDDFVYKPELIPLIELASIIKINFMKNTPYQIFDMLKVMKVHGKRLLAERIETQNMYYSAKELGFELFQGFFFSKPVTLTVKKFSPLKMNYMSLLMEISEGDKMDYGRVADIIRRDVALCHKLLRMINSVYYGLRATVTDIRHALALIGTQEISKWIYFMSVMEMGDGKPDELIRMSMIRAFFLERLPDIGNLVYPRESLFLLGMFSLLDLLMEQPMKSALAGLDIDSNILEALLRGTGEMYALLRLAIGFETGDWDSVDCLAAAFDIERQDASDNYLRAVKMCNEILA